MVPQQADGARCQYAARSAAPQRARALVRPVAEHRRRRSTAPRGSLDQRRRYTRSSRPAASRRARRARAASATREGLVGERAHRRARDRRPLGGFARLLGPGVVADRGTSRASMKSSARRRRRARATELAAPSTSGGDRVGAAHLQRLLEPRSGRASSGATPSRPSSRGWPPMPSARKRRSVPVASIAAPVAPR